MTIVENLKNMNLNEIEIDIIDRINTVYTYDITEPDSIDMYGFAVYCYCKLRNHYADFPIEELKSESDHFDFELSPQMESVFNNASFANEKYDIDHQGVALEYLKKNYHLYYDEEDYDKEDSSENWDDPNGIHYELLDDSYERICATVDTSTFKKLSIGVTNAIEKKDVLIPEWFDGTVDDEGEFTVNPNTGIGIHLNNVELSLYDTYQGGKLLKLLGQELEDDSFFKIPEWFKKNNIEAYNILFSN
tara:strand:+ start:415 stop:1155 length:741 start_codon:yes stop_codon:yes gene_type:complete